MLTLLIIALSVVGFWLLVAAVLLFVVYRRLDFWPSALLWPLLALL